MRFILILCFFVCFSCSYFEKKKLDSNVILEKELQTFKWDEVDHYPTFETCGDTMDYLENKGCFESTITAHISEVLNDRDFVFSESKKDTIWVYFLVSKAGEITLSNLKGGGLSEASIQNLNEILSASLLELPKLFPAIKRSQHVQTIFQLPIILNTNADKQ
ncbi:hypothetical protein N9R87_01890 [Flavobacteriaceae bacterium]|nr:hypothetical protein [Flavobacteriaceae bacterium]